MKEILIPATTWVNHEELMLSKINQSQNDRYGMIALKARGRKTILSK